MLNLLVIISIAISLSMDTFSLSIIYGTLGIKKEKEYLLSIIVGIYHFVMPLIGNSIGKGLLNLIPFNTQIIAGIILIIVAIEMINQKEEITTLKSFWSLLLFGLAVSLDSFSVGIGLSSITRNYFLSYFLFALTSLVFTFIGLKFGYKLGDKFGKKARIIGGIILIIIGLVYVF